MNVARINMSHGTYSWHEQVIKAIKTINSKAEYSIAILLDTKGAEVRTGDLPQEITIRKGDRFTFTVRREARYTPQSTEVSYDGFIDDVKIGDTILIDGGLINFKVLSKTATDVLCECLDGGILSSRRHLNIRGKTSRLPSITKKDWKDIDFGISHGVDFIALSFIKDAKAITLVKEYLSKKHATIDVIAKIESAAAVKQLPAIIAASDGVMIARGDLGAEVPLEEVPLLQSEIVRQCRETGRPVIIATHLLESMITNPTPTRAEVTDIAQAIREGADSIMLSGETATGNFPMHAVAVMDRVARHLEARQKSTRQLYQTDSSAPDAKEEIARSATIMANNLGAKGLLVFTRRGLMAMLISKFRPQTQMYALTNMTPVRRKLNLYWGIQPFRIDFSQDPEKTIQRALELLMRKELLKKKDRVVVVSDILAGSKFIQTIQVRDIG